MPTPAAPETRAALSATPAIEPTGAADVLAHPLESRRDALVARLLAAGFVEVASGDLSIRRFDHKWSICTVPTAAYPAEYVERAFLSVEEALGRFEAAKQDRQGDAVEPAPTLAVDHATRIMAAEMAAAHAVLDGYSVAPKDGTLATRIESLRKSGVEVQAERDYERQRANEAIAQLHDAQRDLKAITAALDADPERSPAWDDNDQPIPLARRVEVALMPGESQQVADLRASFRGIEQQLGEVDAALHALGSYGLTSTKERLLQVLPAEDRRALLELDAAELRAALAHLKARRLNPPPAERVAEYQRKLDIVEAKLCSLDHLPGAGKKVNG